MRKFFELLTTLIVFLFLFIVTLRAKEDLNAPYEGWFRSCYYEQQEDTLISRCYCIYVGSFETLDQCTKAVGRRAQLEYNVSEDFGGEGWTTNSMWKNHCYGKRERDPDKPHPQYEKCLVSMMTQRIQRTQRNLCVP